MLRAIIILMLLIPTMLCGQTAFVPCKDIASFKKQYTEASKNLQSLKCNFVQEKSISMLKDKLVSNGEFAFKKPDRLRMEFKKPYSYIFILNGTKIFIQDNQKKTEISASGNKLFKKISQITVSSVSGDILNSSDFSVVILENSSQYMLQLTPKSKEIKELFKLFQVYISRNDNLIHKIDMTEVSGDNTTITFTDKKTNLPLNDALFTLK
jgi:outer membrane lipoprotein-sorting protein